MDPLEPTRGEPAAPTAASQPARAPRGPRLCVDTAAEWREAAGPGARGLARATFCLAGGRRRLGAQPRLPLSSAAPHHAGSQRSWPRLQRGQGETETTVLNSGRKSWETGQVQHPRGETQHPHFREGRLSSPERPQRQDSAALAPVTGGWGATGPGPPTRRPRSGARPLSAPGPGPLRSQREDEGRGPGCKGLPDTGGGGQTADCL